MVFVEDKSEGVAKNSVEEGREEGRKGNLAFTRLKGSNKGRLSTNQAPWTTDRQQPKNQKKSKIQKKNQGKV